MSEDAAQEVSGLPDAVGAGGIDAATVTVVYQQLLGRDPDPEGLSYWTRSGSLEYLLRSICKSEDHQRRVLLSVDSRDTRPPSEGLLARVLQGDGLVALDDDHPVTSALATLPWVEIADGWRELPTLVLGLYGRELAREAVRRGHVRAARAGFSALPDPGGGASTWPAIHSGSLVLTDQEYLPVIERLRPDIVAGTLLRLLHPVSFPAGQPVDERQRLALMARRRLHTLGFVEVDLMFGRTHGGAPVVLDTTYTMPDPGELLTVRGVELTAEHHPSSLWLVARRVPRGDRA